MKSKETAFLVVAVFFRVLAVSVALYGIFMIAAPMAIGGFFASLVLLKMAALYFAAAIALWLLSKPIALLVVSGLTDDPEA
jgi:hypothetical protein